MNNTLEHKGYYGTVEYSSTDKVFHGKVIGIKGLISYEGKSVDELNNDFISAIDEYLEMCEEEGVEPQKTYKGSFNIRIEPILHKKLVDYSAIHGMSLNSAVEKAIREFVN